MGSKHSLCKSTPSDKYDSSSSTSNTNPKSIMRTTAGATISPLKKSFINGQLTKDSFKILKVIGRGSFGKVFLVEKKEGSSATHFMNESTTQ